jgi:hypothetical protein
MHSGAFRQALEEYGQGVNVLRGISSRLTEQTKASYFDSPEILQFKNEALTARKTMENRGGSHRG